MTPSEQFFISESVRHARSLPHPDCVRYLRGLKQMLADQEILTDSGTNLACAIATMLESEAQLDHVSASRMRFDLLNVGPFDAPSSKKNQAAPGDANTCHTPLFRRGGQAQ